LDEGCAPFVPQTVPAAGTVERIIIITHTRGNHRDPYHRHFRQRATGLVQLGGASRSIVPDAAAGRTPIAMYISPTKSMRRTVSARRAVHAAGPELVLDL
jgi:hypothetical protein